MPDATGLPGVQRLRVSDVVVEFGGRRVLHRAAIALGAGEIVALQGPSGSGKSTLLRVIAGLLQPASGRVEVDGRDVSRVPTHRRGIAMVFQDEQLFPHRSVAENVEFGLRMHGVARPERAARVEEVLALVGMTGFGGRRVTSLSGGEAKRIALARSLAPRPSVLLLDEPLTGLDRELHDDLAHELARVLRLTATTALLVTHDEAEATAIADRIEHLPRPRSGRTGEDLQEESAQVVDRADPRSSSVQRDAPCGPERKEPPP